MCSVILDQVVFGILHLNLASEAILILPQVQPIITDTCAFEGFYMTYFHAITHLYGYEIVVFWEWHYSLDTSSILINRSSSRRK